MFYTFVIDTNQYAGQFDRELSAYITGSYGECKIGYEIAKKAQIPKFAATWFFHHLKYLHDRDGQVRSCSLVSTPGWFHDGLGVYYQIDKYNEKEAVRLYNMKTLGFMEGNLDQEDRKVFRQAHPPLKIIRRWPAYLSVGIHTSEEPNYTVVEMMKRRAYDFSTAAKVLLPNQPKINIIGFRMIAQQR